jgi:hypothetical protein
VEKFLNVGFIYPVPLTEWVSNLIPIDKKQGTIHVCMDFRDLNKSCPKDNFPTPFIDQIIDECAGSKSFLLWMDFQVIIKFKLNLRINIRRRSFVLGVHLHTRKCLSALKTCRSNFSTCHDLHVSMTLSI